MIREAAYTNKWLKQKLEERYEENIFFTDEAGPANVVCFRDMASNILSDKTSGTKTEKMTLPRSPSASSLRLRD